MRKLLKMQFRNRTKKGLKITFGVVLAFVLLPPVVIPMFIPWTEINCRHEDINIKTGQARCSRYIWYVKTSEEVKDTPISVALRGQVIDVADIQPWFRVNTFSPGLGHSPHYAFHGALSQARRMEVICEQLELGPEQRRQIAENILKLWQTRKRYFPVDDYLQTVMEEGMEELEQRASDGQDTAGAGSASELQSQSHVTPMRRERRWRGYC